MIEGKEEGTQVQSLIKQECLEISDFLVRKNQAYGNSFASPLRIFARSSAVEQLNVRIDDKLKRIFYGDAKAKTDVTEDTELDLLGYLILKRVLKRLEKGEEKNAEL